MNRAKCGVALNLLGSLGCLAFGVEGMLAEHGGEAAVQSSVWGTIVVASILSLGFGTYLQLTGARLRDKPDFLPFPRPGDFRRRKIRRSTELN